MDSFFPAIGFAELIILVVIIGGIAAVFMRGRGGSRPSEPRAAADVQLNCPHCGQETNAAAGQCRHCGRDL
jgi:hypothetical protein